MRELLNYRRHKEKSCQGYVKNVYQDIWRSTTSCNYFLTTITACKLSDFQVSIRGVKLFEISKRFQQLKVIVIFGHAHFRVFRLFVENRKKKRFATIFTKIIPQKHKSVESNYWIVKKRRCKNINACFFKITWRIAAIDLLHILTLTIMIYYCALGYKCVKFDFLREFTVTT